MQHMNWNICPHKLSSNYNAKTRLLRERVSHGQQVGFPSL